MIVPFARIDFAKLDLTKKDNKILIYNNKLHKKIVLGQNISAGEIASIGNDEWFYAEIDKRYVAIQIDESAIPKYTTFSKFTRKIQSDFELFDCFHCHYNEDRPSRNYPYAEIVVIDGIMMDIIWTNRNKRKLYRKKVRNTRKKETRYLALADLNSDSDPDEPLDTLERRSKIMALPYKWIQAKTWSPFEYNENLNK